MLTIAAEAGSRTCDGVTRRACLRAGFLGLGGLGLGTLLAAKAWGAAQGEPSFVRDKQVLLVFLTGAPSQYDLFNPNLSAPEPYRSVTGEVATSIPGVTFGGQFPRLAAVASKMTVVRSYSPTTLGAHEAAMAHVLSGGTDPIGKGQQGTAMASLYARLRGGNHPESGLPTNVVIPVDNPDSLFRKFLLDATQPGVLGPSVAPFVLDTVADAGPPRGGKKTGGKRAAPAATANPLMQNMELHLSEERLGERRALLEQLGGLKRERFETRGASHDQYTEQAFQVLLGDAAQAFDLSRESRATLERYDTSDCKVTLKTSDGDPRGYKKDPRPSTFGKHLLMARRLLEAGAGFVTVQSTGWDMHSDQNNASVYHGMRMLGPALDKGLSALIEDLEQRGLTDRVLVVVTSEFGRTPKLNLKGGRDHWAQLGSLAFIGGGLPMGQVIGRADPTGGEAVADRVTTPQLMATIMHTLFDVGTLRVARGLPADLLNLIVNGRPIPQLIA